MNIYICIRIKNVIITILLKTVKLKALEKLREFEIKPSMQRIAIMEFLIDNRIHPSVEDIYNGLSDSMPTLSKTTVYNTLKLFEEHRAIISLTIDEKNVCYDIDTKPHAHFICKNCSHVEDFDIPVMSEKDNTKMAGNLITEAHFYYKGICKNCLQTQKVIINNN